MNCGGFVFLFRCSPRSVDPNRLGKSLRFWYSVDDSQDSFATLTPVFSAHCAERISLACP